MAKISIIVPIYGVEKYLRRCIDSILLQTFTDFELILVDDESPDNCPAICDEYAKQDKRIKVVHKKNGGVSAARNTGIDIATAEYIAFVDGDDYVLPHWFMQLVQAQEEYNADCVLGNYAVVHENGALMARINNCEKNIKYCISTPQEKLNYFFNNIFGSGYHGWEVWNRLFLRSIIDNSHIRFPVTCENFGEDLCFVLTYLLYSHNLVKINAEPGYCYCIHDSSMMQKSKSIVKLNALNEVSLAFGERYFAEITHNKKEFYALHFLIMNNQYQKLPQMGGLQELKEETKKIKNQNWYRRNNKPLISVYKVLKKFYGQSVATHWTMLAFYAKYQNWFWYKKVKWFGEHIWIDKRYLPQRILCKLIGKAKYESLRNRFKKK